MDLVKDYLNRNCPYMAGAISYYTLFSMFPLFLAVTSVLGYILGPNATTDVVLAKKVAEVLPVSSDFVSESVEGIVSTRAITGVASILGLLLSATAAFGAIRKGINTAWGIKTSRPFLKERLIDFALAVGAGIVLLIVLFSAPAFGVLREVSVVLAPHSSLFDNFVWTMIPRLVSPVISFLAFMILYRFLPNTAVSLSCVWPWALLVSLGLHLANLGFVWYVQEFAHYNVVYGSVGAVLALLTWVYLSAMIVLFGAVITSRYTAYVSNIEKENRSHKILWTGFCRVNLRIVESAGTG